MNEETMEGVPVPPDAAAMGAEALALYVRAWKSPAAQYWTETDAIFVSDWAMLRAHSDRRLAVDAPVPVGFLDQIRRREDSLGISPYGRRRLAKIAASFGE